jgi:hypothetical protein
MTLKKHNFTRSQDRESLDRIIVSVAGLEKQGKTHFALTAPGPVALFSTDIGEEGVTEKFEKEKEVWVKDVARIDEDAAEEAPAEWDRFKSAYLDLMKGSEVRSIVVDTATEIWELLRMARFGRLTQVMPYQYGPVNAEFRALIREAYKWDKNLILLHKMKAQYINDKRTGEWERAGFSDMGFLVQVNTQVYRYDPESGGEFCLWVKDCRQNPDLAGEVFEGEGCSFPMLAMNVLPNVDPSAWM